MGPFMVEIVFCMVTRRGRKKKAGMNKAGRANMRNDGCGQSFVPKDDMVRITIDLSDTGPVFGALDEMMAKLDKENKDRKKGGESEGAKKALKNLLKSGIPGIESMFGGEEKPNPAFPKKAGKKGFHKMNDSSKKKFMNAIFGEEGTQIDASTAAALLATTCSGGNPEIGDKLAELLMPEMGDQVDPTTMASLMSACSLIQAGSSAEEVMKIMQSELASSGLSEEKILERTQILMKAFNKEEAGSTAEYKLIGKQKNSALKQAEISPKDFTAIVLAHKAIAACGTTPENVAKLLMIKSTLLKKGANPAHVAGSLKNLGQLSPETKGECIEAILKAWEEPKIGKPDVHLTVRVHQALDNENEPSWAEVKQMKEIVGGVSANSPEAIELNLARATKSGGLKKDDIGRGLVALKAISSLGVDTIQLAKVMFMEKTIADNGVPAVEIGRVLSDGMMPPEPKQNLINEAKDKLQEDLKPADVESSVKIYNNLKLKSNIPHEVIEHVDNTLIQVRCSLEDVADNMISTMSARGEKEHVITRNVIETLKNTGATANVVSATVVPPFKELTGKNDCELTKIVGRGLKDVDYSDDDVTGAVVEMTIKIIEENPELRDEACAAMEAIMKDFGGFPDQIRQFMKEVLPPPPTPPTPPMDPAIAAELERLHQEELARAAKKLADANQDDDDNFESVPKNKSGEHNDEEDSGDTAPDSKRKPGLKKMDSLKADSRRGSVEGGSGSRRGSVLLGGGERRGSFYDEGVTTRASVAVITDDPEQKKKLKKDLDGVFNSGTDNDTDIHQNMNEINSRLGLPLTTETGTINSNLKPGEASKVVSGIARDSGGLVLADGRLPAGVTPTVGPDGNVVLSGGGGTNITLPAGATVVKLLDGSCQVVLSGQGPGAATTLPSGKVERTSQGTLVVKGTDGKSRPVNPGTFVQQNPDGSSAIVTIALDGSSSVVQQPVALPPTAKVQTAKDGSIEIVTTAPDGTKTVTKNVPAGSYIENNPDGSQRVVTVGKDGSVVVAQLGAFPPQGQQMTNASTQKLGAAPAGVQSLPNGASIQKSADGSIQIKTVAPDGKTIISKSVSPGSYVQNNPDGSVSLVTVSADGSMNSGPAPQSIAAGQGFQMGGIQTGLQTPVFQDGSSISGIQGTLPAGACIEKSSDGTIQIKTLAPDGKSFISSGVCPGSYVSTNPDGSTSLVTVSMDGNITSVPASQSMVAGQKLFPGQSIIGTDMSSKVSPLPTGSSIKILSDGSLQLVSRGPDGSTHLRALPQGSHIQHNSDGTQTLVEGGQLSRGATEAYKAMVDKFKVEGGGALTNGMDAISSIVGALPPNVTPEVIAQMLENSLCGTGMSQEEADKLLAVFATDVSRTGVPTVSSESRALMQQILSSTSNQEEISSRVTALLAGTALSTSRGEKPRGGGYGEVKMAEYNVPTTDLSASISRRRPLDNVQGYLDPNDTNAMVANNTGILPTNMPSSATTSLGTSGGSLGTSLGTSVGSLSGASALPSRQSVLLQSRERRRRREEESEKANAESTRTSYYRKVIGLRRAKVPLMVYSCGGFSRCFRIARFYDVEGPPVGVTYDRDLESRAALNPDL